MTGRAKTTDPARETNEKPPALVFYSDILGFADFVRARPADHVRRQLLVAAVDAERVVKWAGVNVTADTVRSTMSSSRVEQGVRDLAWLVRESDGTLLVNPFLYLARCRGDSEAQIRARLVGQDTMLLVELHAFRFLLHTLGADAASGRIVDSPAAKYLATVEFARHVLGSQHFEVLSRVAMSLPDSRAGIESAY